MINNRGGRKRELSIYSILTIIALTLISEGCGERDRRETGKDAGEAGVLVSAEFIKLGTDGWEAGIIDEIRKTQEGKMYIDRITIDGKRVTGNPYYGNRGSYVELSPGKHTYRIEIKTNQSGRFFVGLIEQGREASWSRWGEIEVERSRMYVVIAYLFEIQGSKGDINVGRPIRHPFPLGTSVNVRGRNGT